MGSVCACGGELLPVERHHGSAPNVRLPSEMSRKQTELITEVGGDQGICREPGVTGGFGDFGGTTVRTLPETGKRGCGLPAFRVIRSSESHDTAGADESSTQVGSLITDLRFSSTFTPGVFTCAGPRRHHGLSCCCVWPTSPRLAFIGLAPYRGTQAPRYGANRFVVQRQDVTILKLVTVPKGTVRSSCRPGIRRRMRPPSAERSVPQLDFP